MSRNNQIRIFDVGTAIITGGASGIGRSLALELSKRGCEVVIADRQVEAANELVEKIHAANGKATAVVTDVTDYSAVEKLVNTTVERTGRLDYMFNNAGIGIGGAVTHYTVDDWNLIVDVNLNGVINGVTAAYNLMLKQGFGHIVNTASVAGFLPGPGSTAYTTTKFAIVGLSKSLRLEAASLGVRVSVLCPGVIRTPILDGGGKFGKMLYELTPKMEEYLKEMWEKYKPMNPDLFATKALDLIAKNKAMIILPTFYKWFWRLHRFFPSYGMSVSEKNYKKITSQLRKDNENS